MSGFTPLEIGLTMGLIFSWAVLALALALRLLNFPDLTVEGSLPLGGAVYAALLKNGVPMSVTVGCALLAGALAGAITAFLHVHFRLNKFLAGIIVVAITYSVSLRVMGAANIGLLQLASLFDFAAPLNNTFGETFHLGTIVLLCGLLAAGSVLLLMGLTSRKGIRLRVAGSNPDYARTLGINVPLNMVVGLAVTNSLVAFSGVLLAMHQGFADVGMGQGVLILALAAMTVGERILPKKALPFHLFIFVAAVVGSILYQVLVSYAVRLGLAPTDLKLVTAVLVLLVVALRMSDDGELFSESV